MEQLKMLRLSLNLDKLQMAQKIGVSLSLYDKIEKGERQPSREFINKLKLTFPYFDTNIFFYSQTTHNA